MKAISQITHEFTDSQVVTLLSIIVPAYNEERTIVPILQKVVDVELINGIHKEIIVVNDCSRDNTAKLVQDYISTHTTEKIVLINQPKNQGKGAAIHTGIAHASGDYIVVQDADMEYDPEDYNILLKPITSGFADVVYGSRLIGGKPHRILFFWHTLGNHLLTTLSNIFTNLNLSDMETCYKMFRAPILKRLHLCEKRFGFEPEVTAKMSRVSAVRIYEVGISYYGRTYAEGKKINWRDGFRAVYCIIKYNFFCK
ncbi:glycosyl transferase [Bacteroidia bacterium]|nr:glycosyl transferase [Bacteroidia bacterium]